MRTCRSTRTKGITVSLLDIGDGMVEHHGIQCGCMFTACFAESTSTKPKTLDPVWNECFVCQIKDATKLILTVFHKASLSTMDEFVANCTICFIELANRESHEQDFWVSCWLAADESLSIVIHDSAPIKRVGRLGAAGQYACGNRNELER